MHFWKIHGNFNRPHPKRKQWHMSSLLKRLDKRPAPPTASGEEGVDARVFLWRRAWAFNGQMFRATFGFNAVWNNMKQPVNVFHIFFLLWYKWFHAGNCLHDPIRINPYVWLVCLLRFADGLVVIAVTCEVDAASWGQKPTVCRGHVPRPDSLFVLAFRAQHYSVLDVSSGSVLSVSYFVCAAMRLTWLDQQKCWRNQESPCPKCHCLEETSDGTTIAGILTTTAEMSQIHANTLHTLHKPRQQPPFTHMRFLFLSRVHILLFWSGLTIDLSHPFSTKYRDCTKSVVCCTTQFSASSYFKIES